MRNKQITAIGGWLLLALAAACSRRHEVTTAELRNEFGPFSTPHKLNMLALDYSHAPVMKKINAHPEAYRYLDSIQLWRIAYESDGHFVTGFLAAPKAAGNYPCIIYNRGGNRNYGALLYATAVENMGKLAAAGYIVAASNYRGNSGGDGVEEFGGSDVRDVLELIRCMQHVPSADTTRIGLLGISRGGMMNYLALKNNPRIRCAVSIGGISNLDTTAKYHPEMRGVYRDLIPGYAQQPAATLRQRSATAWCDSLPAASPLLILHGTADDHVHISQAYQLADSLSHYKRPYRFVRFEGGNHGLHPFETQAAALTLGWFERYLKKGQPFAETEQRSVIR